MMMNDELSQFCDDDNFATMMMTTCDNFAMIRYDDLMITLLVPGHVRISDLGLACDFRWNFHLLLILIFVYCFTNCQTIYVFKDTHSLGKTYF